MNPTPRYINTHLHDHLSILDGVGKAEDYCKRALEIGQKSIAITNHGNIDSFYEWSKASEKYNIKVIFGCEIYLVKNVEERPKKEKKGHCCLWVQNENGYSNLLKILSYANMHGFYYRPRCSFDFLYDNCENLIIGTACTSSFINLEGGEEFLEKISKKTRVFLEIMAHSFQEQKDHNEKCLRISEELGIPLLASHDCHYPEPKHAKVQEVLLCMQSNDKMSNPDRWKFDMNDLYLCDGNYILESFERQGIVPVEKVIQAMKNTIRLSNECNFKIKKKEMSLPLPPQFEGKDVEIEFRNLCLSGLKNKLGCEEIPKNYLTRFETEYEVIRDKGFIPYFLIVFDAIDFCSKNKIMTGPRGSAAGCLISYALGLFDIDPLKYDLIFERFISVHRSGYPDIDLDVADNKRGILIERLKNLYGEKRVSHVSTILKMEARGVIRDVSRVYDIPLHEVNNFCKGIDTTIEDAIENTVDGKEFYNKYKEIVDIAISLQGQAKSYGKHAGGIIISPVDLDQSDSAHIVERGGATLINWSKDEAELAGLIKFDFLGLKTMAVISDSLDLIKGNHGKDIDLYKIDINDKKVYEEISKGNTVGLFQISSYLLTKMAKEMGVENMNQLSDLLAIIRPGPLETITPEYLRRKKGEPFELGHPIYNEITKDTYNLVVYQEQIMFIFHKVAGMSMADSDEIRRVISKKKSTEELAPWREAFISGCLKMDTFSEEEANSFFDDLLHFCRYGFNRSHSISYGFNTFFTTWLKINYPEEFICASLTYGSSDKVPLVTEAFRLGLKIIPPKLETSHITNWVARKKSLFVPFKEVKGLGGKSLETIKQYQDSIKPGFFKKEAPILKGKLLKILQEIGAFNTEQDELPDTIDDYFLDLGITLNPQAKYKKLYSLIGDKEVIDINNYLSGDLIGEHFGKELKEELPNTNLINCVECELRNKCKIPAIPKRGKYNIAIIDEQPNNFSDKNHKYLFNKLEKAGFEQNDFNLTYFCKCQGKKPTNKQIMTCSDIHLSRELEDIRFVLAFGNSALNFFRNEEKGIVKHNGQIEWSEEHSCWVCYCLPISFVDWKPEEFKSGFDSTIKKFIRLLEQVGGFI